MTFSLLAADRERGSFGAVISSSSPAVAARCLAARADVGIAVSQNITDPRLRTRVLDLLAVYNNYDFDGPLELVRKAADLSDGAVPARMTEGARA